MKKSLFLPFFLLILLTSGLARATEESSELTPLEKERRFNRIYDQTTEILLKSGYSRWFQGLRVGQNTNDFELTPQKSIQVLPVVNRTGEEPEKLDAFLKRIGQRTVLLLENTKLFSSVTYGDQNKEADYRLEIYVRGLMGKNCLWGLDLYDQKTGQKLLSGFDKESSLVRDFAYGIFLPSSESPTTQDYLIDNIPKKAALFVGRTNPTFNQEYFSKLQKPKGPRGY